MTTYCVVGLVFNPKEKIQLERLFYSVLNQKNINVSFIALDLSSMPIRFCYDLFAHPFFKYQHLPATSLNMLIPYLLNHTDAQNFFFIPSSMYLPPYFFSDFDRGKKDEEFNFLSVQNEFNNNLYKDRMTSLEQHSSIGPFWATRNKLMSLEILNLSMSEKIELVRLKERIMHSPPSLLTDLEI
jgi:hypothetical protein